jgi:threonine/homoserine/homoserine lactone efflux protein
MPSLPPEILAIASILFFQLLAIMSPGPSFLVTARTAVTRSRGDGILVAFGLMLGAMVWATAALFGLSALFKLFPLLYMAMKIMGGLFLLWIAWQIFMHAREPVHMEGAGAGGNPFLRGFLIQVSNPKVVVFFGSIFVALLPANPPLWMMLTLLVLVGLNELWWYVAVALFFGTGPVRKTYLAAKTWIDRVTAVFLGAVGLRLMWSATDPVN